MTVGELKQLLADHNDDAIFEVDINGESYNPVFVKHEPATEDEADGVVLHCEELG